MTRLSEYLLPTEKEAPADAEAISHRLMVRAGLIRQLGAGMWSWLPAGWRVHQRIVQIIREEMNAIGGQEMLMPVLEPAEIWRRTGRLGIAELFKLFDRREAELVLALSHEEAVTTHVAQVVRSYRDLPLILYHFQVKERDEPRPRAGVLRTREFIMKDSYTFDRDLEGLEARYQLHVEAYDRIMDRTGLRWYRVEGDVGMMGGVGAHEYMAPCAAGENEVVIAPGYAANLEVAVAQAQAVSLPRAAEQPVQESTPGLVTVEDVAKHFALPEGALLKAYPVVADGDRLVLVLVRGDHRVNDVKLTNALGADFRGAQAAEIEKALGPVGFIGPVGLDGTVEVLMDRAAVESAAGEGGYVAGANRADQHLSGVKPGRDFSFQEVDIRSVQSGDTIGGAAITIEPAIEVGNIFKLGTRYSEPLGARYLDEQGHEQLIWMGSYGIGPARIAAAAVEQFADEKGISWPRALAPFAVHLVGIGRPQSPERAAGEDLYERLCAAGVEVLYDDRDAGAGEKFADAELLGCPVRLTLGKRAVESGVVEAQLRRGGAELPGLALSGEGAALAGAVDELWRTAP